MNIHEGLTFRAMNNGNSNSRDNLRPGNLNSNSRDSLRSSNLNSSNSRGNQSSSNPNNSSSRDNLRPSNQNTLSLKKSPKERVSRKRLEIRGHHEGERG